MTIDKEKLRALTQAATKELSDCIEHGGNPGRSALSGLQGYLQVEGYGLAKAITGLLDEIQGMAKDAARAQMKQRESAGSREMLEAAASDMDAMSQEVARLKAENEALRDGANHRAIQSLRADCDELRKAIELHAGYHAKADRLAEVEKDLSRHKRMLLSGAVTIGQICELLGLDENSDFEEVVAAVRELRDDRDGLLEAGGHLL